ncbi:MAG TPA: hypothetical protein VNR87_00955 [Flavisolibacter sp.]|nr:hypothetical protein [Flavisolibacter sp.]
MKKTLTLFIAVVSFAAVQAQTSKDEARKVILGQPGDNGRKNPSQQGRDIILGGGNNRKTYPDPNNPNSGYPNDSRQARIDQVNREYDAKVYSIRANGTLSASEKERMIRQLEQDRAKKIRQLNGYEKKRRNEDDDDERHDHGKHKGWTHGKGNAGKQKHEDD